MLKRMFEDKSTATEPAHPWEATAAEAEEWRKATADLEQAKRANRAALKQAPKGPDRNHSREIVDASTQEMLARHRLLGVESKIRSAARRRLDPIAALEG